MIARAPYIFLLLILIPDLYFDLHYWRHKLTGNGRLLRWLPSILMIAYTVKLAYEPDFIPSNPTIIYIYLFLLGMIVVPKLAYMVCSVIGLTISKLVRLSKRPFLSADSRKQQKKGRNYGNLIGLLCVVAIWYIVIYGSFVGFRKLEVKHIEYVSPDLPKAFDGYRITLFSDAHVGTYAGSRKDLLRQAVDSINAQKADMIVFVGDLQNTQPQDIYPHMDELSRLRARDGVFSVLGNHDYAQYIIGDDVKKVANCRETASLERQMGWTLLSNEHRYVNRGKSGIVIAGMENDGDGKHFPQKGDVKKTLKGVGSSEFVVMLEHDPSAWRRKIIPDGRAQLTLSGHTHNMQLSIFGWSPISLLGREVNGWYHEGRQSLFVTAGLGGLIPFRFGATGELVVITLKSSTPRAEEFNSSH